MSDVTEDRYATARQVMIQDQLQRRGIREPRVLAAMDRVPRESFVSDALRDRAYDDGPLPIGDGQTISQPYMVARMLEVAELRPHERVLEIGAGSGYQTALLCELAARVFAVERLQRLGAEAKRRLVSLGYRNLELAVFDGTGGWPEHAPYDAILVAAGAPAIPPLLVDQLADGGRLVIPVGPRGEQKLTLIRRRGNDFELASDTACTFVDLIGRYGWGGQGTPRA